MGFCIFNSMLLKLNCRLIGISKGCCKLCLSSYVFVFLCCKIFAGREAHVMTFEVGDALEDAKWQAHVYCFDSKKWQRFSMAL